MIVAQPVIQCDETQGLINTLRRQTLNSTALQVVAEWINHVDTGTPRNSPTWRVLAFLFPITGALHSLLVTVQVGLKLVW